MNPNSALPLREAETLMQQGISHANAGRLGDAQSCFRRAIALCPDFAQAHHNLGVSYAQQGASEEAIACLNRALQLQPNYPEAHFNLGNSLNTLRRRDEAISHLRQALALRLADYAEAAVQPRPDSDRGEPARRGRGAAPASRAPPRRLP